MYDWEAIVEVISLHFKIYSNLGKDDFEYIKKEYSNYD